MRQVERPVGYAHISLRSLEYEQEMESMRKYRVNGKEKERVCAQTGETALMLKSCQQP